MFAGSSYNVCVCCESSVRQHWLCLRFPLSFLSKVPWNDSWKVGFSAGFAGGLSGSCAECVATVVFLLAEGFRGRLCLSRRAFFGNLQNDI